MQIPKRHKILSIALAFLLLNASFGWSLSLHYCNGMLLDYSLFGPAEACAMEAKTVPSTSEVPMICGKSCCDDQQISMDTEDARTSTFAQTYSPALSVFVATPAPHAIVVKTPYIFKIPNPKNYIPPLLYEDLCASIQRFLL